METSNVFQLGNPYIYTTDGSDCLFLVPTQTMSLVCLYVCESVYTWVQHGDGGQEKGGIASHEGLWQGIVDHNVQLSLQSVRLAPHLLHPSVHLPITHKPAPPSTVDYTVLAHWLALWNYNIPFYTKKCQFRRQTITTEIEIHQNGWTAGSSVVGSHLPRYRKTSNDINLNHEVIFLAVESNNNKICIHCIQGYQALL